MKKYFDLTLPKQVEEAAKRAAARYQAVDLDDYWERLLKVDPEDIWQKLTDAPEMDWRGAVPVYEPAGISQTSSGPGKQIIAVDGSQINPDRDMAFRWAYVHAVAVDLSGEGFFESDFLDLDSFLTGDVDRKDLAWLVYPHLYTLGTFVDLWRTQKELEVCAQAVSRYPSHLILWDNPLWPAGSEFMKKVYASRLSLMHGKSLAGVVSGPRSQLLSNLIALSETASHQQSSTVRLDVDDSRMIRHGIPIGSRSAVFRYGNPFRQQDDPEEIAIFFFFIRVNEFEVARVEVPEWIGKSPEKVNEVHATILNDSYGSGYSFSLLSAHHAALVSLGLGRELNMKALNIYSQHGGKFYWPAKLLSKLG